MGDVVWAIVLLVFGGVLGLAAGWWIGHTDRRPRALVPDAPEVEIGQPAEPSEPAAALADEAIRRLIDCLIAVRDALPAEQLHAQRIGVALESVGVHTIDPTGEPFDPARHQQVDSAVTSDPGAAGSVAEVELVGYEEGGQLIRFPQVVVWRRETGDS